ncbi:MAG: hypothetical protein JXB03_04025 [Spirochaetales bacterium]|nr:hypothetical protein [Spirochaetales bacterium]
MPTLEDIEKFKAAVNALGHEPSILAERGEKLEDVPVPTGLADDLSELLSDTSDVTPSASDDDVDIFDIDDTGSDEYPEDADGFDDELFAPDDLSEEFSDTIDEGDDAVEDSPGFADFSFDDDVFTEETEEEDVLGADTGETTDEPQTFGESDEGPADDFTSGFSGEPDDADFDLLSSAGELDFLDNGDVPPEEDGDEESFPEPDGFSIDDIADADTGVEPELPSSIEEAEDVSEEGLEEEDSLLSDINEEDSFLSDINEVDSLVYDEETADDIPGDSAALAEEFFGSSAEDEAGADEFLADIDDSFSLPEDIEGDIPGEIPQEAGAEFSGIDEEPEASIDDFGIPDDLIGGLEEDLTEAGQEPSDAGVDFEDTGFEDLGGFEEPESSGFENEVPAAEDTGREEVPEVPIPPEEFSLFDEGEDDGIPEFSMPKGFPFQDEAAPSEEPEPSGGGEGFETPADFGSGFESGIDEPAFSGAPGGFSDEFEIPSAGDIDAFSDDDFEVDEFNLGDLGAQFGEFETHEERPAPAAAEPLAAAGGELEAGDEDLHLSAEDMDAITRTLGQLPLNLKIVIEELIGEKDLSGEPLRRLLERLIAGAPAKELASMAGKISGKKIRIPSGYEKSTGEAFELEKGTLGYTLRYNVLPILRVTAAALLVIAISGYLGFNFLYRPLHALVLYNRGYDELGQNNFSMSESYFAEGLEEWVYKGEFFRYARAYQQKGQFKLAANKYQDALRYYPFNKSAILEYGSMESSLLENHVKAEEIFGSYLDEKDKHDYEVLLAAGDNYLAWGDYDPSKYEDARYSYAVLIQHYGRKLELLFRMTRYFIRTDKYEEVEALKAQFEATRNLKLDPYVYTEMAGYFIDKNKLEDVRKILFQASEVKGDIPETHYQLGRYFREVKEPEEERKALAFALTLYSRKSPLLRKDMNQYIDGENRLGEVLFDSRQFLDAEQHFLNARRRYEDAAARRVVVPGPMFGRIYKNLGDLYYYVSGEMDAAFAMFEESQNLGYTNADVTYKKGYINYLNGEFLDALKEFYSSEEEFSPNTNLMFAMANTFFQRRDFHSAEGYYARLLERLERERDSALILEPEEREDHAALMENIMRTRNNLGVVYHRLSQASNNKDKFDAALVEFTGSMELFDLLTRDPETDARREVKNLAYVNQRAVLFPMGDFDLQIYPDIPLDLETLYYR